MTCLSLALHDPEAERWAVAAALVHIVCTPEALEAYHHTRDLLPLMLRQVRARDFLGALEREAWAAIEDLAGKAGPGVVNQLTVAHELARRGVRDAFITTLSQWVADLPTPLLGVHAARLVREAAERRRGLQALQRQAQALARGERAPPRVRAGGRLSGLVRR
jgi:hypothetical protein